MTSHTDNVLVAVPTEGTAPGSSLAFFGDVDATLPTAATGTLDAGLLDAGWVTTDGLTVATSEDSTPIPAFGAKGPIRTLYSNEVQTFALTFMESNPVTLAVYHRKALGDVTLTTGAATVTGGGGRPRYSVVFEMVDGDRHLRVVCPNVEVSARGDIVISAGTPVQYPVTLTAYPDEDNNTAYWYYAGLE